MHSCDNRNCVNPKHLSLGEYSDNSKDAFNKGRIKLPENTIKFKNGHVAINAVITREKAKEIREIISYKKKTLKQISIINRFKFIISVN